VIKTTFKQPVLHILRIL